MDIIPIVKLNLKIGLDAKSQVEKTGSNCVEGDGEMWIQVKPSLSVTAQLGFEVGGGKESYGRGRAAASLPSPQVKVAGLDVAKIGAATSGKVPEPSDYSPKLPEDGDDKGYAHHDDGSIELFQDSEGLTSLVKKELEGAANKEDSESSKFNAGQSTDDALCFGPFESDTEHHECMNDNGMLTHCMDSENVEDAMTQGARSWPRRRSTLGRTPTLTPYPPLPSARFCKMLQCRDVASAPSGHEFSQRCHALFGRNCVKQCDELTSLYGPDPGASGESGVGGAQAEYAAPAPLPAVAATPRALAAAKPPPRPVRQVHPGVQRLPGLPE